MVPHLQATASKAPAPKAPEPAKTAAPVTQNVQGRSSPGGVSSHTNGAANAPSGLPQPTQVSPYDFKNGFDALEAALEDPAQKKMVSHFAICLLVVDSYYIAKYQSTNVPIY